MRELVTVERDGNPGKTAQLKIPSVPSSSLCDKTRAMSEVHEAMPPCLLVVTCSSVFAQPGWATSAFTLESDLRNRS